VSAVAGMVVATRPFDPVRFIGEGWGIIPEERDLRSAELSEVDFFTAIFETCLKEKETSIKGEEKLTRLKVGKSVRFGVTVFMGLWFDYEQCKEDSILERLYKEKGITYLDFFGDVLLGPRGFRSVLCLCRSAGGVWGWSYRWLDYDWNANNHSASLANGDLGLGVKSS